MGRLRRLQDAAGIRLLEAYGCYRLFLHMASYYLVPAMQNCFGEKCVTVERIYITLFLWSDVSYYGAAMQRASTLAGKEAFFT